MKAYIEIVIGLTALTGLLFLLTIPSMWNALLIVLKGGILLLLALISLVLLLMGINDLKME